jgi:hypothetical protein
VWGVYGGTGVVGAVGWVEGEGLGNDRGGSCKLFVCTCEEQFWSFAMLSFQLLWNK